MTDVERFAKMDATKKRILNELVPDDPKLSHEVDDVEKRDVDKNWNSSKIWMYNLRITSPMNNDLNGIGDYNTMLHDNNGVMVTVADSKPLTTAPIVK